ncbi:hypothetical protein MC885_012798 [Smutsia gigantea]|nr:hypothetical protein MC885_012798 [Smutsia gigantea]
MPTYPGGGRLRAGDPLHGATSRGHCALLSAVAERRCEDCPASGFEESVSRGFSESEVSEIRWAAGAAALRRCFSWGRAWCPRGLWLRLCAQTEPAAGGPRRPPQEKSGLCDLLTQPGAGKTAETPNPRCEQR